MNWIFPASFHEISSSAAPVAQVARNWYTVIPWYGPLSTAVNVFSAPSGLRYWAAI